uniref:Uncharacterized protein n=1 Tax=viral metagenome TaxID=1070528 RepID=A0A6C0CYK7_9ZZZZ
MDDDAEFSRYNKLLNVKKKKEKKEKKEKNMDKLYDITIDDLLDPDTNLTDMQRVMKKNRELLFIIENLKYN